MPVLPKISSSISKEHGLITSAVPQQCTFGKLCGKVQEGPQDLKDKLGSLFLLVQVTGKMQMLIARVRIWL